MAKLLPSLKWSSGVGAGTGFVASAGVAAGMMLNPGFASFVLGLSIAGFSLGGLGLPLLASAGIAAVIAGVGAFALGAATYAVGNTVVNILKAGFGFVRGLFSSSSSHQSPSPESPIESPIESPSKNPEHGKKPSEVSPSLKGLGGQSPKSTEKTPVASPVIELVQESPKDTNTKTTPETSPDDEYLSPSSVSSGM